MSGYKNTDELAPLSADVLCGHHVELEPLAPDHAAELHLAGADDASWTYLPRGPLHSETDALDFIERARGARAGGRGFPYAIRHAGGPVVGSVQYSSISPANRSLELAWFFLHPAAWGTYIPIETVFLLLEHAIMNLGACRVWAKSDCRNDRVRRVLARTMTHEGTLRRNMRLLDGTLRDSAIYAILDDEWPLLKQRLAPVFERANIGALTLC